MPFLNAIARAPPVRLARALGDERAGSGRVERVEDADRDALLDRRLDGGGMEDLRAEVRELRGLGEADFRQDLRGAHHPGIDRQHAVHVRPDLDGLGGQGGADDGGGVVGSSAAERGRDAVAGGGDVAGQHRHLAGLHQRKQLLPHAGLGLADQRQRAPEGVVGDEEASRVHGLGRQALLAHRRRHDRVRETLAHGRDGVQGARAELAQVVHAHEERAAARPAPHRCARRAPVARRRRWSAPSPPRDGAS